MGNYFYGENLNNYDGSKYHDYYQKGKAEYYGRKMSKNNMPYVIDNNNVRIPPRYHDDYNKYDDRLSYQGSNLMIEKFMNNRNISNVYNGLDYIKPKYTNKNRDRFYGIGIRRRPILSRPDSKYDDIYLDNENMRRLRWHRDKLIFARRK